MSTVAEETGIRAVRGLGGELLELATAAAGRLGALVASRPAGELVHAPRRRPGPVPRGRNFDAAAGSRLRTSWGTWSVSADSEVYSSLTALRGRSRDHAKNNPHMVRFLSMVADNVAGPNGVGFQASPLSPDGTVDERDAAALELAFRAFSEPGVFETTGLLGRAEVERLVCTTTATDGEFLARWIRGAAVPGGLSLHVLDPDRLDLAKNEERDPATGLRTVMGVDLDDLGRPHGYWILRQHPSSSWPAERIGDRVTGATDRHLHLPAEDVIHCYLPHRVEAHRGLPWARASMTTLEDLAGYQEAAVINARHGANKLLWYSDQSDVGMPHDDRADDGTPVIDAELGSYGRLPAGVSLETWDPDYPHSQYGAFVEATLRTAGAGLNLSYHSLGNDLSRVNFSSANVGVLEERNVWRALQRSLLIAQFNSAVYREWLRWSLTTGTLPLPASKIEKFRAVRWNPRTWPAINRVREATADGMYYSLGATSISEMIRATGRDPDEVWRERAAEDAAMERYGVEPRVPSTMVPIEDDAPAAPSAPPSEGSQE